MVQIPREFVREVVDRTSIVQLVSQHVQLRRRGSTHVGLCPFHREQSPSFYVSEDRKNFHCFGCNKSGDPIDWLEEMDGLSFVDAVKELAGRAGLKLPEVEQTPAERAASLRRELLLQATEHAAQFFEERLRHEEVGREARDYLIGRGYTLEFAKSWRVGLAPESWDSLRDVLARARIPEEVGVEAGLLKQSETGQRAYDFFRHRLMFPICGADKKVVAFGGRALGDDKAKYINTPETPIYSKSSTLFGLHEQRTTIHKADRVLFVEGYFDVLGMNKAGLKFAVAPCGTALTDRQLSAVRRHTKEVTLLFDSDEAGRRAAMRALEMCLEQGLWPLRLEVPDGKDPDAFVQQRGGDATRELLEGAKPLLDFYIDSVAEDVRARRNTADGALEAVAPMLGRLGNGNTRFEGYVHRVHAAFALEHRVIKEAVDRAARKLATQPKRVEVELPRRAEGRGSSPVIPRPSAPPPARPATLPRPPAGAVVPPSPGLDDDFVPPDDRWAPSPDEGESAAPPPAPPESAPSEEQLALLRLLVQDLPNVGRAVYEFELDTWISQPSVVLVVRRFVESHRAGRRPTSTDLLDGVLHPAVVRTVAGALASDASWVPEAILDAATKECILRLRRDFVATSYREVKRELDALQRGGDVSADRLRALSQRSIELQREREQLDGHLRGR